MFVLPQTHNTNYFVHSWKILLRSSSMQASKKRVVDGSYVVLIMLLVCLQSAAVAEEEATEFKAAFDIPRQRADHALTEFAEQADLTLVFPDDLVRDKSANELVGTYSLQEGIELLLRGTGLIPTFSNEVVLSISADVSSAQEGEAVNITKKTGLLAALASIFSGGVDAQGQDTSEVSDEDTLEEIVVVGTHIRGSGAAGSTVHTYTRDDIDVQGYSTVPQFVQSLPQNFSGGISESTSQVGGTRNGELNNLNNGTGINLRGLGNSSTLVLVNGQRQSPAGDSGSFVDISMIPLSAIDSVELLTDGASAIYGSDAIGGVVNFKLRRDFDGAETRLRYGEASGGELAEVLVGQTFGKTWDRGYGLIAFEHLQRDALDAHSRSFSKDAPVPNDLLPEQKRNSVFLSGGYQFGQRYELFVTANYSDREGERLVNFPPAIPLTVSKGDSEQYGGTVGLTVEIGNSWRAKLVGSISRNKTNSGRVGRVSKNDSFDLTFDGTVFSLPGGDAKLAIGGHSRRDSLGNTNEAEVLLLSDEFSRDVSAVFGELYIPLVGDGNNAPGVRELDLSISARYEDYSDFGSSTDPKFGVMWSPVEGLRIKGTYGTSFRAPLLTELDEAGNVAFMFGGIPNPASPTGSSVVLLLAGPGNLMLQPETATVWTAGFEISPENAPGLNIGVTTFNIEYDDKIGPPPFSIPTMLTDPILAPFATIGNPNAETLALIENYQQLNFTFPPVDFPDADAVFDGRVTNLSKNEISGYDLLISYSLTSENANTWHFSLSGTHFRKYLDQAIDGAPKVDVVGTINNPVKTRLTGGLTWGRENFSTNISLNYVDSYRDDRATPATKVASWTTTNVTFTYNGSNKGDGWFNDTVLSLSAVNLFDRAPPFVASLRANTGINYDPGAASPMGRVLGLQITRQW